MIVAVFHPTFHLACVSLGVHVLSRNSSTRTCWTFDRIFRDYAREVWQLLVILLITLRKLSYLTPHRFIDCTGSIALHTPKTGRKDLWVCVAHFSLLHSQQPVDFSVRLIFTQGPRSLRLPTLAKPFHAGTNQRSRQFLRYLFGVSILGNVVHYVGNITSWSNDSSCKLCQIYPKLGAVVDTYLEIWY